MERPIPCGADGIGASELYDILSDAFGLEAAEVLDLSCNDIAEVIRRLEERPKVRIVPSVRRNVLIMRLTDEWSVAVNRSRDAVFIEVPNYALIVDEHFLLLAFSKRKYVPVEKAKKIRTTCAGAKEYSPSDVRATAKEALRNELSRAVLL